jgi:hypothetical protein
MRRLLRLLVSAAVAISFAITALVNSDFAIPLAFSLHAGLTIYYLVVMPFTADFTTTKVHNLLFEIVFVQLIQTFVLIFKTTDMAIAAGWLYTFLFAALLSDYV